MSEALQVPVKGLSGEDRGTVDVPAACLDARVRYALLKEAVLMYRANQRVGTHSTKTRSEVAGSTKKPWKQKGTGRARAGSRKSPLWRGGGVIFGPRPRDYSYQIPRKQRRLALRSALSAKLRDGEAIVLDGLSLSEPKTSAVAAALKAANVRGSCLLLTAAYDKNIVLSARNIPGVVVSPVGESNALDVLRARTIVLTREALDAFVAQGSAGGAEGAGEES